MTADHVGSYGGGMSATIFHSIGSHFRSAQTINFLFLFGCVFVWRSNQLPLKKIIYIKYVIRFCRIVIRHPCASNARIENTPYANP